jgi:transposase-like protein
VHETLFKIGGRWRYAFRAIDEDGQIVDVLLSDHRDGASARALLRAGNQLDRGDPYSCHHGQGQ